MEVHKKVVHIRLSLSCNMLISYKKKKETLLVNTVIPPEITKIVSIQTEVKRRETGFQCDTTHGTHLQHWGVTLYIYMRLAHNELQSQTESPRGETYRKRLMSS